MKKTRRLLCLLLTVVLALSLCAIPAAAADDQARSDDPVVFVHGLLGWGQRDRIYRIMPYWGMTTGSLTDYLSAKGYETYAASVGPLSSAWDRACELYAQLVGARTDYGVKHAQDFGHERYGIDYEQPLFDGWGTKRAVNLVGHSFGGATTRLFLEILTNGCPEEVAAARAVVDGGMAKPEAMERFGIASATPLKQWCRLYRGGGAEALRPRPRGRPRGSGAKAAPTTREQELEREVRRLEAQVAYLKKSMALKAELRSRTGRRP